MEPGGGTYAGVASIIAAATGLLALAAPFLREWRNRRIPPTEDEIEQYLLHHPERRAAQARTRHRRRNGD